MEISPKLNHDNPVYPQNSWYFYYAGYADGFIKHSIEKYRNNYNNPIIVDPWNGSGTTTVVASMMGLISYGFDLNPAMLLISKAKLYNAQEFDSTKLTAQLQKNRQLQLSNDEYLEDPLNIWFTKESVAIIRSLEEVIQIITGVKQDNSKSLRIKNQCSIEALSIEASFFYLALFRSIKQYTSAFVGSNPTWIKSKNIEKLNINSSDLKKLYLCNIEEMINGCTEHIYADNVHLSIGNSKNIPLKDYSADIVITSPPYCTRIDYAVYTKIELSLLGYNNTDIQNLRREMIGTPTIRKGLDYLKISQHFQFENVSDYCLKTMEKISTHQSKAAKSYYYKTYIQYFAGMYESMKEIYRVLNTNGIAIIVVQDSWFKDVYIDVPEILIDFAKKCGFSLLEKNDFEVKNSMNYINTKSRKYQKTKKAVESVVIIKKG